MNDDIDLMKSACKMLEEIYETSESILKDLDLVENQKINEGAFDSLWYHSTRIYNLSKAYLAEIEDIKGDLT